MLYGFTGVFKNKIGTMVCAADTVPSLDEWFKRVQEQTVDERHYVDVVIPDFLELLTDDDFAGLKYPPYLFHHKDEEQREQFVLEHRIITQNKIFCLDRQEDMRIATAEMNGEDTEDGVWAKENADKTVKEILGLEENDPWDKRSEEEKEQDRQMRQELKKKQKSGDMSGDSFGAAEVKNRSNKEKEGDDVAHVRRVNTSTDDDGNIVIDSVIAQKIQERKDRQRIAEEVVSPDFVLSPEDFAAALEGDGSHYATGGEITKSDFDKLTDDIDTKFSPEVQEIRKRIREEEERKKQEGYEQIKKEMEEQQIKERDEGIFRGCDLVGDEMIAIRDLPEQIQNKVLADAQVNKQDWDDNVDKDKVLDQQIPMKKYPYNSVIDGKYLFPFQMPPSKHSWSIIAADNLKKVGVISVVGPSVLVATKEKDEEPAWVVYQDNESKKMLSVQVR